MTAVDYSALTALSGYYNGRTTNRPSRHWAIEKLGHDLAAMGILQFFEGPGTNPMELDDSSTGKLWLECDEGVTTEVGTWRFYNGGTSTALSGWSELTPAGFLQHLGNLSPTSTYEDYATVAAVEAATISVARTYLRTGGYYSPGDGGGGLYKLVATPGTPDARHIQSADGAYWQLDITGGFNVKAGGAKGDTSTDDTTALQAVFDVCSSTGNSAKFPRGTYTISAELVVSGQSVKLIGENRFGTLIRQTTLNAGCVQLDGLLNSIEGMSFIYVGGTPTSGATAVTITNSYSRMTDFIIRNCHTGVDVSGANAVGVKITDFDILDYESIGIKVSGPNDVFISRFIINAGNSTRGALGGIRLVDRAEAVNVTDGDILQGVYSLTVSAAVDAIGLRPAYNKFLNVYFDSATTGCSIANLYISTFTGCWFSGGRSGGGSPGMTLNSGNLNRFDACEFVNCGSHGALVNSGATKTTFDDCLFVGNSVTTGSGVSHGLAIASSTAEVTINGGMATNAIFSGTQQNGVFLGSSTTDILITGVNVKGNNSAGIGGNLSGAIIRDCPGFVNRARGSAAVSFGTNGNGTVAHGLASTPTWANAVLLGDTALQVDVESLGASNLVLRLRDAAGADVTSGTPTVMWEAEF